MSDLFAWMDPTHAFEALDFADTRAFLRKGGQRGPQRAIPSPMRPEAQALRENIRARIVSEPAAKSAPISL